MNTRKRQAMSKLHRERGKLLRRMAMAKRHIAGVRSFMFWDRPKHGPALDAAMKALTVPRNKR